MGDLWASPTNFTLHPVGEWMYLGREIDASGGTDLDVESRIKKARSAFGILSPVWRNSNLSTSLKLRLFKSNVVTALLYGCCAWKVTSIVTLRLQIFLKRCLRKIFASIGLIIYVIRSFYREQICNLWMFV